MKINKTKLNLIIDIVMFINMMVVVGIGFFIKYVLVSGAERNLKYGRDVELYFWGFDRHQWGYIHLIAGFLLLFLLLLHIVFHWKMIVAFIRNYILNRFLRFVLIIVFVIVSVLFGVMPLMLKPEVREDVTHHYYHRDYKVLGGLNSNNNKVMQKTNVYDSITLIVNDINVNNEDRLHKNEHNNIEINGSMTLNDVAKKYNISLIDLASNIHVPLTRCNENLGRLRKEYSFNMNDLRDFVKKK
ncbi:MAG: DUF4405 domain-containing protein [Marinilabiliaceae bacterium]|nr:DUF4405 domain-containing protein [Marinilabiliaceae bacterium]